MQGADHELDLHVTRICITRVIKYLKQLYSEGSHQSAYEMIASTPALWICAGTHCGNRVPIVDWDAEGESHCSLQR